MLFLFSQGIFWGPFFPCPKCHSTSGVLSLTLIFVTWEAVESYGKWTHEVGTLGPGFIKIIYQIFIIIYHTSICHYDLWISLTIVFFAYCFSLNKLHAWWRLDNIDLFRPSSASVGMSKDPRRSAQKGRQLSPQEMWHTQRTWNPKWQAFLRIHSEGCFKQLGGFPTSYSVCLNLVLPSKTVVWTRYAKIRRGEPFHESWVECFMANQPTPLT